MPTRKEQKARRQEEILIAALNLFTQKGYASTKTSDIARAVHMSDGLLFHYFPSKQALFETLIDCAMEENRAWVDRNDTQPADYFHQVAAAVLHCIRQDDIGAKFFLLIAHAQQGEGIPESVSEKLAAEEKKIDALVNVIRRGQADGTLREGDPCALAYLFSCTLQGIAIRHATHPNTPLPEPEWIVDLLRPGT